ncbi:MAG: hypothetical protein ACT4PM_06180 [Gemmatimonadales bacterium]
MRENELPDEVRGLIQASVPTPDALEVLVGIARSAPATLTPEQLAEALRPAAITVPMARGFLRFFRSQGIVVESPGEAFRFEPANPELERAVRGLIKAYDERPVTLIRTVYELADQKALQAFSDAFRLKKDE